MEMFKDNRFSLIEGKVCEKMCEVCDHNVIHHVGLFTCKSMSKSNLTWPACWTYANSRSFVMFKFPSTKPSEAYFGPCHDRVFL